MRKALGPRQAAGSTSPGAESSGASTRWPTATVRPAVIGAVQDADALIARRAETSICLDGLGALAEPRT